MSAQRDRLGHCNVGDWVDITRGYMLTPPPNDGFWPTNCLLDGPTSWRPSACSRPSALVRPGERRGSSDYPDRMLFGVRCWDNYRHWIQAWNSVCNQQPDSACSYSEQSSPLSFSNPMKTIDRIKQVKAEHPDWGCRRIAQAIGISRERVRYYTRLVLNEQGINSGTAKVKVVHPLDKQEASEMRSKLRKLEVRSAWEDRAVTELGDALRGAMPGLGKILSTHPAKHQKSDSERTPETALLVMSDTHVGKRISTGDHDEHGSLQSDRVPEPACPS